MHLLMSIDKIMKYLTEAFNGFENCFLRFTVENLLNYAVNNFSSVEEQVKFVVQILPEVTADELFNIIIPNNQGA